ncbi:tetratricopeptide repeat protein [Patescibacteria group bacterium]|nr:tetratricopeptide repeat protein [Patescibacteria group bacterium]
MVKEKDFEKVKKASKTINKMLDSKNIKMPSVYYYKIGRFYFKARKYKNALEQFRKALKINPKKATYYLSMAQTLSYLEENQKALEYAKKTIRLDSNLILAWCLKGSLEGSLGNYKQALATFKNNIIASSKCSKDCVSLPHDIGLTYLKLHNYRMAIKYCDKALKRGPKNKIQKLWLLKGICFGNLDKHRKALEYFNKILRIAPNDPDAILNKITTLNCLGKYKLAMEWINRALKILPKDDHALMMKALALERVGRYKESLKYFNKSIQINPKNDVALTNKGSLLCRLNRHEEEIKCYEKAIKFNPRNHVTLANYGHELIKKGAISKGLKSISKALRINPNYTFALCSKAYALHLQRKNKLAIACLKKAIKINNKDAAVFYNLACLCSLMNRNNEAFGMLRKAIQMNKNYKIEAREEPDFKNIQNDPRFKRLIN